MGWVYPQKTRLLTMAHIFVGLLDYIGLAEQNRIPTSFRIDVIQGRPMDGGTGWTSILAFFFGTKKSWICLRWFFTDCTMVNHHQTTMWDNIFGFFSRDLLQMQATETSSLSMSTHPQCPSSTEPNCLRSCWQNPRWWSIPTRKCLCPKGSLTMIWVFPKIGVPPNHPF